MTPKHPHVWGMTHETWSYVSWGTWIGIGFMVREMLARDLTGVAPWFTLTQTFQTLVRDHPLFGLFAIFFFVGLAIHLLDPANKWGL